MHEIEEGSAKILISDEKKISRRLEVFYNPAMKLNRDLSILLLNSVNEDSMQIADPLAGTGVRAVRFIKELLPGKIRNISANDHNRGYLEKTFSQNGISGDNIHLYSKDANLFLIESKGFDYIDIDPFGSPNPFLESSILRISRGGILAVTATDTAALAGNSPGACMRKYWAKPLRNELMHETGIRILIRKIQLVGAQFEKSFRPIYCYSKDHYYRVFLRCEKGKTKADKILANHKYLVYDARTLDIRMTDTIFNHGNGLEYAGPLWAGELWEPYLAEKMEKNCDRGNRELFSLVSLIGNESKIKSVGFYDLHKLAAIKGTKIPKAEDMVDEKTARTHFCGWCVRSEHLNF